MEEALKMVNASADEYLSSPRASNDALFAMLELNSKLMLLKKRARWLRKGRYVRQEVDAIIVEIDLAMKQNRLQTNKGELLGTALDGLVFYFKRDKGLRKKINASRQSHGFPELPR